MVFAPHRAIRSDDLRRKVLMPVRSSVLLRLLCAALLLVSVAIFYPQIILLKGCFLTGDHREQHYPWAHFLSARIAEGKLPWWTWKIHCGFPLLAEGQMAALYPPNYLFHLFFPADFAYSINFVFHVFLSGLFMLIYCRRIGLSWSSAALACLCYLYGNAFGGAFYNINSLKTLAWFPLTLVLADGIREKGRISAGVALGLVFAFQLLAGYLQIAVYSIGIALFYFMLRGLFSRPEAARVSRPVAFRTLLVSLPIAGLLFLPQFLSTYPLSQMSGRVGLSESFAYLGSFPPWGMVTLLFPKLEGLLRTTGVYVGIFPLFLAMLGLCDWKRSEARCWALLFLLALLLAMGGYSPLYIGLVKVTHFYGFRVPSKMLFFANTALAVLAGLGMEALLKNNISDKVWRIARNIFFLIGALAIIVALAGRPLLDAFRDPILHWGAVWAEKNIYGKPYHGESLAYYRDSVNAYFELARNIFWVGDRKMVVSLVFLSTVMIAVFAMKRTWKSTTLAACCLAMTATDLYAYHFVNKLSGDISTYDRQMKAPASALFLAKDTSLYRIFGYRGRFEEISLMPSFTMLFGIDDVGAYSPLALKRYRDLLEGLGAVDDSTGRRVDNTQNVLAKLPLLSSLNVKYILTPKQTILPGLPEVFTAPTEHIYRNPHVQDRFFFARELHVESDPSKLMEKIRSMDFSSMRDVWLEEETSLTLPSPAGRGFKGTDRAGNIQVKELKEDRIMLDVETATAQLLFASLTHYPGVVATVDGQAVKLYRANYCFCGIVVPPGRHQVVFAFDWKKSLRLPQ